MWFKKKTRTKNTATDWFIINNGKVHFVYFKDGRTGWSSYFPIFKTGAGPDNTIAYELQTWWESDLDDIWFGLFGSSRVVKYHILNACPYNPGAFWPCRLNFNSPDLAECMSRDPQMLKLE